MGEMLRATDLVTGVNCYREVKVSNKQEGGELWSKSLKLTDGIQCTAGRADGRWEQEQLLMVVFSPKGKESGLFLSDDGES